MIFRVILLQLLLVSLSACNSTQAEKISSSKPKNIKGLIENRSAISPILFFEAIYPETALNERIQGHCKVSFDLKNDKSLAKPQNIKIMTCEPLNVFEDACVQSVSKWLFKDVESLKKLESTEGLITTCKFGLNDK